jgi:hypothetical protein
MLKLYRTSIKCSPSTLFCNNRAKARQYKYARERSSQFSKECSTKIAEILSAVLQNQQRPLRRDETALHVKMKIFPEVRIFTQSNQDSYL